MAELSEDELRRLTLDFLREFKDLMGAGHYRVENHLKNWEALTALKIKDWDRLNTIQSLVVEDYSSGPTDDEYRPSQHFWVFGKELIRKEIYIKLMIVPGTRGNEWAICKSFHIAEFPMKYPLRKRT